MHTQPRFTKSFIQFLHHNPSPQHVSHWAKRLLRQAGFEQFSPADGSVEIPCWYYPLQGSGIVAFKRGRGKKDGLHIVGAHLDSPALQLLPHTETTRNGFLLARAEPYGGIIRSRWVDRPLRGAGELVVQTESGLETVLFDSEQPIAIVAGPAIHLDRGINDAETVNPYLHLQPLLSAGAEQGDFAAYLHRIAKKSTQSRSVRIVSHRIYFFADQTPQLCGIDSSLLCAPRLDNLASCYAAIEAFIGADAEKDTLVVLYDHEEIGSQSPSGAAGSVVSDIVSLLYHQPQNRFSQLHHGMCLSCDGAHGFHPAYPDRFDEQHQCMLNIGPVLKWHAAQRYATSARSAAIIEYCAQQAGIPLQHFSMRSDMPCGSTIGPIMATKLGICTVDVGIAQLAMHSTLETTGARDPWLLYKLIHSFIQTDAPNPG